MELPVILTILGICLIYRLLLKNKYKKWFVFIASIVFLFYIQPISTIRYFDFWISFVTLFLSVFVWEIISNQEITNTKNTKIAYGIIAGIIILLSLLRFLPQIIFTKYISIPPITHIFTASMVFCLLVLLIRYKKNETNISILFIISILVIFVFIKNSDLSLVLSKTLRKINDQSISLSTGSEIVWIGYSYFAFRIMHVLFEFRKKKLSEVEMHTFISYLLFFPTWLAGPIMYVEKFKNEINHENKLSIEDFIKSFKRIGLGLFQKFILADMLAVISLNESISRQVLEPKWMWLFTITYALRIYFDFNGYSHLAIGIAGILGINLPENFNKPIISPTLTLFWNNWHITLTQWFRSYYFNPTTRFLRRNMRNISPLIILAFMQISTMVLIGLWHGISWNFVFWGLWIGIGLFIQNQVKTKFTHINSQTKPQWQLGFPYRVTSTIFTFIYVSLGWVWFALPSVESSLSVFKVLVGSK